MLNKILLNLYPPTLPSPTMNTTIDYSQYHCHLPLAPPSPTINTTTSPNTNTTISSHQHQWSPPTITTIRTTITCHQLFHCPFPSPLAPLSTTNHHYHSHYRLSFKYPTAARSQLSLRLVNVVSFFVLPAWRKGGGHWFTNAIIHWRSWTVHGGMKNERKI